MADTSNNPWYPSPEFLAQAGHVLLGMLAVLAPRALWDGWMPAAAGTAMVYIYMLVKEFSYDIYIEKETVAIGWKDIAYLSVGTITSWGLLIYLGRL